MLVIGLGPFGGAASDECHRDLGAPWLGPEVSLNEPRSHLAIGGGGGGGRSAHMPILLSYPPTKSESMAQSQSRGRAHQRLRREQPQILTWDICRTKMDYQQSAEGGPNRFVIKNTTRAFPTWLEAGEGTADDDRGPEAYCKPPCIHGQSITVSYPQHAWRPPLVSAGNSPNINSPASTTMH